MRAGLHNTSQARRQPRRISIILLAITAAVFGLIPGNSTQADTRDQTFESNCSLNQGIWRDLDIAQTFTADLSGWLTAFDIQLLVSGSSATEIFWEIQGTEPSRPPDTGFIPNGVIATSGILPFATPSGGWQTIFLPVPIHILSGEMLAIVLKTSVDFPEPTLHWCMAFEPNATYSGGEALRFGGTFWSPHTPSADHDFRSYVPEPSHSLQIFTSMGMLSLLHFRRRNRAS